MYWSFAIINGRLAEVFFDKKGDTPVFLGHCYVRKEEYPTKREQRMIERDIKKNRLSYRKGEYRRMS